MTDHVEEGPISCAHCGREIANKGQPSMGGNHEILWMHVPGGTACYPQQGGASPRAIPTGATASVTNHIRKQHTGKES